MPKKINVKGPIVNGDSAWIYKLFGWECACPGDISAALEEAAGDDVVVEINSNGGLCTAGFEMYTALKAYEGKVTAHVINACSAATFLICAADEALISDAGIVMIHNTQVSGVSGDYRDMQMEADALKEFNECIINVYENKTGKTREELQNMMNNDTYMSPAKAIENGFCDGYMFKKPENSADESDNALNMVVNSIGASVFNSTVPIISDEKAEEFKKAVLGLDNCDIKAKIEALMGRKNNLESSGENTERAGKTSEGKMSESDKKESQITVNDNGSSEIKNHKEENKMTYKEMLEAHPEVGAEVDSMLATAREEGVAEGAENENKRLKALDGISTSVTADALEKAKYGNAEERCDAKELAYQAMLAGKIKAEAYIGQAIKDSKESGVEDVGSNAGKEDESNEADELAAFANKRKGVM